MKMRITSFMLALTLLFTAVAPTAAYAKVNHDKAWVYENQTELTKESSTMNIASNPILGNGSLKENFRVTFMDGNNVITATSVPEGATVKSMPQTGKAGKTLVGWYKDKGFTEEFFGENPVTEDLVVYAKYEDTMTLTDTEEYAPSFFSLEELEKEFVFKISVPSSESLEALQENVSVSALVETDNVKLLFNLISTEGGKSVYEVSAEGGYKLSASYKVVLNDESYVFLRDDGTAHENSIRELNLLIKNGEEQNNIAYSEDVAFIKSSDIKNFKVNEDSSLGIENFDSPALVVDEDGSQSAADKVTGSFNYSGGNTLKVGQIITIYTDSDPRIDMNAQSSFVKITAIDGSLVEFSSLEIEDTGKLYKVPATIMIFDEDGEFPTNGEMELDMKVDDTDESTLNARYSIDKELYDILKAGTADENVKDSIKVPDSLKLNDIIIFTNRKNATVGDTDAKLMYAVITEVSVKDMANGVYTVKFEEKENQTELEESLNSYVSQNIPYNDIESQIDEAMLIDEAKEQIMASGFIDGASENMVSEAFMSEDFFEQIGLDYSELYDEDGNQRSTEEILLMSGFSPAPLITPPVIEFEIGESSQAFKDGIGLTVGISMTITIEPGRMDTTRKTLQIDLETKFTQELSFGLMGTGKVIIVPIAIPYPIPLYIIPIPIHLSFNVSVDIKTYTHASIEVTMFSLKENLGLAVKQLKKVTSPVLGSMNQHALTIGRIQGYYDMYLLAREVGEPNAKELLDESQKLYAELQKEYPFNPTDPNDPDDIDFKGLTFDNFIEADINITQASDVLGAINDEPNPEKAKAKTNELIESYEDLVSGTDSEWMELVKIGIFGPKGLQYQFYVIDLVFQASFVISADILISLKSSITYQYGKRYTFWMSMQWLISKGEFESGSSEMDLLDEYFAYDFSIMGYIGLRMGIEVSFRIGLISIYLANIGIIGEIGVYTKMYGYFVYAYDRLRRMGQTEAEISESAMGAMFVDVGWYAELDLAATVLEGFQGYSIRLAEYEDSLFTAGDRQNVYDFTYQINDNTRIDLIDEVGNDGDISLDMPEILMTMKTLDLKEGITSNLLYDASNFNFISSSEYFHVSNSGRITITPPDDRVRYMEAEIQIVWKGQPLTFTKNPIVLNVPVVWNNLSDEELSAPRTVGVNVIDNAGNNINVWSDMVFASERFYLPSEEEILEMINYDTFSETNTLTGEQTNLKYESITGYTTDSNGVAIDESAGQLVLSDTNYLFEVGVKEYEITVNGVEGTGEDSKTLTAYYGESFDLSSLENTGYTGPTQYSQFNGIKTQRTQNEDLFKDRDFSKTIDISFAKEILDGITSYYASYEDTTAKVTYNFVGLEKEPVTKIYEKGDVPNFYSDIGLDSSSLSVLDENGATVFFDSVSPNISALSTDTSYDVSFILDKPEAKMFEIAYYLEDDAVPYQTVKFIENTIIFPVQEPEKAGQKLVGWYTDEARTTLFTGFDTQAKMTADLKLYGKLEAQKYNVSFDFVSRPVGVAVPGGMEVGYNEEYMALPEPISATHYFEGWYTHETAGVKVYNSTKFTKTEDITLYGRWSEKIRFEVTSIGNSDKVMTDGGKKAIFTYSPSYAQGEEPRAILEYKAVVGGEERELTQAEIDMISIEYQWQRDGSAAEQPNWVSDTPTQGGEYYAKAVYNSPANTNDKYYSLSTAFGAGVVTVNRLAVDIDTISTQILQKGPNMMVAHTAPVTAPDVQLEYYFNKIEGSVASGWIDSALYGGIDKTAYNVYVRVKQTRNYTYTTENGAHKQTDPVMVTTGNSENLWYYKMKLTPHLVNEFHMDNAIGLMLTSNQLRSLDDVSLRDTDTDTKPYATWQTGPTTHWGSPSISNYYHINLLGDHDKARNTFMMRGVDPWGITSLTLYVEDDQDGIINNDDEGRIYAHMDIYDSYGTGLAPVVSVPVRYDVSYTQETSRSLLYFHEGDNEGVRSGYFIGDANFFASLKRDITSIDFNGTNNTLMVTDQFGTYDPYAVSGAPMISVSNNVSTSYDRFVSFTQLGEYVVDEAGVKEALAKDGVSSVEFSIKVTFSPDNTATLNSANTLEYVDTYTVSKG